MLHQPPPLACFGQPAHLKVHRHHGPDTATLRLCGRAKCSGARCGGVPRSSAAASCCGVAMGLGGSAQQRSHGHPSKCLPEWYHHGRQRPLLRMQAQICGDQRQAPRGRAIVGRVWSLKVQHAHKLYPKGLEASGVFCARRPCSPGGTGRRYPTAPQPEMVAVGSVSHGQQAYCMIDWRAG